MVRNVNPLACSTGKSGAPDPEIGYAGIMITRSPFANILTPVLLALATNGLIFALGWTQPDHDVQPGWAPPGYVIGIVWTVLFACMGAARWQAVSAQDAGGARLMTGLIVLCLAYPFYTAGLQDRMAGLAGISVTFIVAALGSLRLWGSSRPAALLLLPLLGWLIFAAVLIVEVQRLNTLA